MRRRAFVLLAAGLLACGGEKTTEPASIVVTGQWQLKSANGAALPYIVSQSGTTKTELTAETLTVNADGTWSDLYSFRVTSGVTVTTTQSAAIGVYTSANGLVSFRTTTGGSSTFQGAVSGNTLTISGATTFVYQR